MWGFAWMELRSLIAFKWSGWPQCAKTIIDGLIRYLCLTRRDHKRRKFVPSAQKKHSWDDERGNFSTVGSFFTSRWQTFMYIFTFFRASISDYISRENGNVKLFKTVNFINKSIHEGLSFIPGNVRILNARTYREAFSICLSVDVDSFFVRKEFICTTAASRLPEDNQKIKCGLNEKCQMSSRCLLSFLVLSRARVPEKKTPE